MDNYLDRILNAFANTDLNILITGAPGTGKSALAERFHQGRYRDRPMLKLCMAAVPSELVEAELFGSKKGAFHGATQDRKGLLQHGGTVFLDEIGCASLALQSKLLVFLQTGEFLPVGGRYMERSNARIIAATNENLQRAVEQGRMRADFRARLDTWLPVHLTGLDGRPGEIYPAFRQFLEERSRSLGNSSPALGAEVGATLLRLRYPDNFRSLQALAFRLVEDRHMNGVVGVLSAATVQQKAAALGLLAQESRTPLRNAQDQVLREAMVSANFVQKDAATLLGVSESKISRWWSRLAREAMESANHVPEDAATLLGVSEYRFLQLWNRRRKVESAIAH